MHQFFLSISFCARHAGFLFILCLPVATLEIALANLITSLDIQDGSNSAALEAISEISGQVIILGFASLIFSVALSGGSMAAFRSLSKGNSISPYQALYMGLKKFFPLLWANILHSFAYGLGFLMLVLPGFYLYGRLGLFPLFIMFEEKGAMDSLGKSWSLTEEAANKLFFLTSIFLGIQFISGLAGGMGGIDSELWFLILITAVKYISLMPLFYLFYSLYESLKQS